MNKFQAIVLLALTLSPVSALAIPGAGIGTRNVNNELRTRTLVIPNIQVVDAGDVTVGKDGVGAILNPTINTHVLTSTSIGALPYPAKLNVIAIDVGADNGNAVTCTSVVIKGRDQYGRTISETVSSVNETAQKTTNVFESISAVTSVCVNGGGASGDIVKVSTSLEVGLGFDIRNVDAIIALCVVNAGADYTCLKGGATDSAIVFDNAGSGNRVNLLSDSINLASLTTNTVDDDDSVVIRYRAPGQ